MLTDSEGDKIPECRFENRDAILSRFRMPLVRAWWFKGWLYSGLVLLLAARGEAARPRFDTSTDMRLVLVPADAEVDSVIFRLRATDQDADFPLVFEVAGKPAPVHHVITRSIDPNQRRRNVTQLRRSKSLRS